MYRWCKWSYGNTKRQLLVSQCGYVLNLSELRTVYVKDDTILSLTRGTDAADAVVVFVVVDVVDGHYLNLSYVQFTCRSSGAVWESRWPSWAVRLNEPSGFRGRKPILNHASALVWACP